MQNLESQVKLLPNHLSSSFVGNPKLSVFFHVLLDVGQRKKEERLLLLKFPLPDKLDNSILNHHSNVHHYDKYLEDDIAISNIELRNLARPLREDQQMISKDDDDELIAELHSESALGDVWSGTSEPDQVDVAQEHEQLELEELVLVEERWDQDEDQSSNQ